MKLSNEANSAQLTLAHQEQFENLFFRVLAEAQRLLSNLKLQPTDEDFDGNDPHASAMKETLDKITMLYIEQMAGQSRSHIREATDTIRLRVEEFYAGFYSVNRLMLAPLFRTLYQLFSIISKSKLGYEQQCDYAKIVRASLNEEIVRLLMLNGLSKAGLKFKPLIEKYGLLKHIEADPYGMQTTRQVAQQLYCTTAFEDFAHRSCYYDAETGRAVSRRRRKENIFALDQYLWQQELNAEQEDD